SGHAARVAHEVRNLVYNTLLADQSDAWRGVDFVYERYSLFGSGGLALARALEVPHLLEVNAPLCAEQEQARGLHLGDVAGAIDRRVWRETDAVLAVSAEVAQAVRAAAAAPERVHVLPNGVDAERFAAANGAGARVRRELELGSGPVVGFIGSLKP